jgi:hypothetical protein
MKTGWLSPTGEFIECDICDHIYIAKELTKEECEADDILLKRGYVKISRSLMGNREQKIYYDLHYNLTPEQIRFLRPYFEDNDICMDKMAQMRWDIEVNI